MKFRGFIVPILLSAVLLLSACGSSLHILVDDELIQNSELLKVDKKKLSPYKMDFGNYRVLYGMNSLHVDDYSNHSFFTRYDSYSESRFNNLVLLAETGDTLEIFIEAVSDYESFSRGLHMSNWVVLGGMPSYVSQTEYYAEIISTGTERSWELLFRLPSAIPVDEPHSYLNPFHEIKIEGVLTDGLVHFTVKRTEKNQLGRRPLFRPRIGYLFYIGEMPVAAVQAVPHHKQRLWLHNDLKPEYRDLLSAASAALMVISFP
jgi:hypothetical protein